MDHAVPLIETARFLEANELDTRLGLEQVASLMGLSRHQLRRRCIAQPFGEWDEKQAPEPASRQPYFAWTLAAVLRWMAASRPRVEFGAGG